MYAPGWAHTRSLYVTTTALSKGGTPASLFVTTARTTMGGIPSDTDTVTPAISLPSGPVMSPASGPGLYSSVRLGLVPDRLPESVRTVDGAPRIPSYPVTVRSPASGPPRTHVRPGSVAFALTVAPNETRILSESIARARNPSASAGFDTATAAAPIPWPETSCTALSPMPSTRRSSTGRAYDSASDACAWLSRMITRVPFAVVATLEPASENSLAAPSHVAPCSVYDPSHKCIWPSLNAAAPTLTCSLNSSVRLPPSSRAEIRTGSTRSSMIGSNGLPRYSADGRPVTELFTAPSRTSTRGTPPKASTAWRAPSPSR